jgi:PAS domain S-box-containing protein
MANIMGQISVGGNAPALNPLLPSSSSFIDSLPIALCVCDAQGRLTQFNARAVEIWGRAPQSGSGADRYCGSLRMFELDGREIAPEDSPTASVLRSAEGIRDRELLVERPDGRRINVLANVNPLLNEDGTVTGAINCFQDVTELRQMQTVTREGRHVFNNIMNALPSAVYATDAAGRITYYNAAAERMWGNAPDASQHWCGSWKLFTSDGAPLAHEDCPMAVAIRERRPVRGVEAIAERPDGTRVPFIPYPTPLFSSDGAFVGAVNLLYDLTDAKKAEAQQKALIDELNHRVKNTLATVQSLAAQSFRGMASDPKQAFEQRLLALSKTHDHLTRERWEWADFRAIVTDTLAPYASAQIAIEGTSVRLPPKVALTLSMVLHELATNAAKYGALSIREGSLAVSWSVNDKYLHLSWHESNGPVVTPPAHKGFGSKLIERSVAQDLGGISSVIFAPAGLVYTCDVALAA